VTDEAIKEQSAKLTSACGKVPLVLSAHSGTGVQEALRALLKVIDAAREGVQQPKEAAWQP